MKTMQIRNWRRVVEDMRTFTRPKLTKNCNTSERNMEKKKVQRRNSFHKNFILHGIVTWACISYILYVDSIMFIYGIDNYE